MKKFFFLALMAFALPMSTWANDANEEFDDNEQEDYDNGSITSSSISLNYKILTVATGETQEAAGTVELEGVATESASANLAALSIPHIIVHVELDAEYVAHTYYYTVTGIAQDAFTSNTTLSSVTIPYSVTYIGNIYSYSNGAFKDCTNLTTVTFAQTATTPSQLTSMGYQTFYGCTSLTAIELPSSVTTLGGCVFMGSALTSIELPASVTSIDGSLFRDCKALTEAKLPESITIITGYCFSGCTNLQTVWMSGSVQIYSSAFENCTSLSAFVLEGDNPSADGGKESSGSDWFAGDGDDTITLYVPTGSAPAYLNTQWEADRTKSTEVETLQWNFNNIDIYYDSYDNNDDGNIYYATYYTDAVGEFGSDVTANIVTNAPESGAITYSSVTGYIPANTGLLLTSSSSEVLTADITTYYYHPYETTIGEVTTADVSSNMLLGTNDDAGVTTVGPNNETEGYYFYKLALDAEETAGTIGFYWGAANGGQFTSAAGKAYLAVPTTETTSNYLSFKKDEGDTTGISAVENASEAKTVKGIYTLQGVRVSDMSQKGVYIVDGKKVLVK